MASDFERRTFEANSCLLKEGEKDKFTYLILVRRIRGMGEGKTAKKGEVNWSD